MNKMDIQDSGSHGLDSSGNIYGQVNTVTLISEIFVVNLNKITTLHDHVKQVLEPNF